MGIHMELLNVLMPVTKAYYPHCIYASQSETKKDVILTSSFIYSNLAI